MVIFQCVACTTELIRGVVYLHPIFELGLEFKGFPSQADQLFDPMSGEFKCTFCGSSVEEDESAMPKKESRQMLATFNEQVRYTKCQIKLVLHIYCFTFLIDILITA